MTPETRSRGARRSLLAGSLAAALWLTSAGGPARAAGETVEAKPAIQADIALAGPPAAVGRVRSVVAELLEREEVAVSTSLLDRVRPEAILAAPPPSERSPITAWIDLGATREVLLYFRDASAQRFVLRRLALENGLDEVAVEEVGHIVKSVVLALAAGDAPALTIAQARAVLQPPAREAPKPTPAVPSASTRLRGEVGVGLLGQLFSPEIPLSPRLDLRLALLVGPERGPRGTLGGWISAGRGETLQYRSATIGLDLTTVAVRAGALWEPWRSARLVTRVGVGGGFDLIDFTPQPGSSGVAPAAAGRYLTPVGTAVAGLELNVLGPLSLGAGGEIDFYTADVHYDVQQAAGRARLLIPYRVRPGLMLTISAIF
jgi:hypothetical protein